MAEQPDGSLGLCGGVLLKPWTPLAGGWREGERLPAGTLIPAEITSAWPINNRLVMARTAYVRYHLTPDEAAQAADSPVKAMLFGTAARLQAAADARLQHLARARAAKAEKLAAAKAPTGAAA